MLWVEISPEEKRVRAWLRERPRGRRLREGRARPPLPQGIVQPRRAILSAATLGSRDEREGRAMSLRIQTITANARKVVLTDGSRWTIAAAGALALRHWQRDDEIKIGLGTLLNVTRNQSLQARRG